jgi:hypothetical protein
LTAGFAALAWKAKTPYVAAVLGLFSAFSAGLIFYWALAWSIEAITEKLPKLRLRPWAAKALAAIITVPLIAALMVALTLVFAGFLTS